ncbi:MAG TPA: uroporphyrinogen-III C-methyltransferase [Gaiellaceae bacterium]|nr:uroporphyrinogen-III C-methyltransferase [Gaiellaceae bacterium]
MGEGDPPHLRGAAALLRRARRGGAALTVYLVGAGPGDPGLITARGLELVRSCDALVYDRLVSPELVAEAPPGALRIGRERLRQEEVEELLVRLGGRGLEVVRLKGGDPLVFGRGGEEALALAAAGVPFEIVPGVSALAAVPAAAGIPLTHRGVSSQVTVIAGHDPGALDFACLARAPGTLVCFMGLATLPALVDGLLRAGKPAGTPSAVIASGTLPGQRVVLAALAELPAAAAELEPPALVVVGEVVGLAARLAANELPAVA